MIWYGISAYSNHQTNPKYKLYEFNLAGWMMAYAYNPKPVYFSLSLESFGHGA